ncbi:hypothetical protein MRB53_010244 [Persea americana]|uniref:Uncharacterized protein n=1 Tax=Persea americana TaxID=3435 RepID=A0ACC2LRE6_PERAE|nr:hypothetical protein MRB53_010244 [Persea americana]
MAVSNSLSSLPIPQPRSPPKYPDLYGTHRKEAELQRMNREIGFLQDELLSVEGMQSASRCCKEVDDFVGLNPDPLIPLNQKPYRSFRIWKWLRAMSCFSLSWICCCSSGPIAPDAHAAAAAAAAATALRNFHADHVVSCQLFNVVLFQLFLALTALAAACGLAPNVQRCLQHRVYIEDPPCGVQRVCTMGLKHSWR